MIDRRPPTDAPTVSVSLANTRLSNAGTSGMIAMMMRTLVAEADFPAMYATPW
ncbi:hypothetical protein X946_5702 [Burkholderia sp. ABCPW 111]|nr:hypothetical protein X946_5702 [Burkholderia sp. ABCPW 111]